ncbi:hypothetical protein CONPUDRAFT_68880 [Coniophora puteana RWD-64-598 SS2]|uniref:Phosphatases II n=1 Tax=Coniophora puteana (strain RWD-64-598) TaxID=741705 RepID=A0A5M3N4V8_CONPW|nr:uncharacterized protein CONPUDRAFT_68880 [Coniophora puteana RWD-64-598 SS2]EIW86338.1 hypothetical protein CONPUDRAFT_68880 [Coniophora puteana RWD-64-598 SS2]
MDKPKSQHGQDAGRPQPGDGPRPTVDGPNADDFFSSIPFGSTAHHHPSTSSRTESIDSFANAIAQRFGQSDLLTARLIPESHRRTSLLPHSPIPHFNLSPSTPMAHPRRPPISNAPSLTPAQPSVAPEIDFPSVSPADLDQYLDDVSTLILDIRPHAAHTAARIHRSLSLSVPSTLLKRPLFSLAKLTQMLPSPNARTKFSAWTTASRILVYDTDSTVIPTSSNIYGLLRKFRLEGFKGELVWLRGGFHTVWKDQRHLVTSDPASPEEDDEDQPRASGVPSGAAMLRTRHLPKSAFNTSTIAASGPSVGIVPTTRASNPFFDTIRQNVELSHGITERIPLRLPRRVRRRIHDLPFRWLQHIARRSAIRELDPGESSDSEEYMPGDDEPNDGEVDEGSETLAMQFYRIELAEQRRLLTVMEHHSRESGPIAGRSVFAVPSSPHSSKEAFPFSIIAGARAVGPPEDKHADLSSVRVAPEPTRPQVDNTVAALALERPAFRRSSDSSARSSSTSVSSSGKNTPSSSDGAKRSPDLSKSSLAPFKPGDSASQAQASRKSSPPQSAGPSKRRSPPSARSSASPQDHSRVHFPSKEAAGLVPSSKSSRPTSAHPGILYLPLAPPAGLAMGPATTSSPAGLIRSPFERELSPEDDYVNASYVQPLGTPKRYIATQGPLPATYVDFWTLCWEQNVHVIVMLTREVENAMVKCGTYWTDTTYGPLRLRLVSSSPAVSPSETTENKGFFFALRDPTPGGVHNRQRRHTTIKRIFELSHDQYPNVPPRRLTHFQYLEWPDMNVPEDPRGVLQLIREVERAVAESSPGPSPSSTTPDTWPSDNEDTLAAYFSPGGSHHVGTDKERFLHAWRNPELDPKTGVAKFALGKRSPVLLHCSAGVGRTGGFITVDAVLDGIKREMRKRRNMRSQQAAQEMAMDVDEPETVSETSKEPQDVASEGGDVSASGELPTAASSKAEAGDSKETRRAMNDARAQQAGSPIAGTVPLHVTAGADRKKPRRSQHHPHHGKVVGENTDSSESLVVHVPYASGGEGTIGPADDKMDLDNDDKVQLNVTKGGWQSTSTREWAEQVSDQTGAGTMPQTLSDPSLPMPMSLSALPSHVPSRNRSPTSGSVSSGPSALNSADDSIGVGGGASAAESAGGKATSQRSGASGGGSGSEGSAAGLSASGSGAGSGLGSGGSSGIGSGISGLASGGSGVTSGVDSGVDSGGSGVVPPSSSISGNSGSLYASGSGATTSSSALGSSGFMGFMRQRLQDDSGTSLSNISQGSTGSRSKSGSGKPTRLSSAVHFGSESPMSGASKSGESRSGGDNEEYNMDIVEQERPLSVPVPIQDLALSPAGGLPSREGSQVQSRESPPRSGQEAVQFKEASDSPSSRLITTRQRTMSPGRVEEGASLVTDVAAQAPGESQKQSLRLGPGSDKSYDSLKSSDSGVGADAEKSGSGGDGNVLSDGSMGMVPSSRSDSSGEQKAKVGGHSGLLKDISMGNATVDVDEPAPISSKPQLPPSDGIKSGPLQKTAQIQPPTSLPRVPENSDLPPAHSSHPPPTGKHPLPSIIEPDQRAAGHSMIDYKLPRTLHSELSPPLLSSYDDPICTVVQDMREQRMSLCQSLRQYVFVHAAVIEGALMLADEERELYGDSTTSDSSPGGPISSGMSSWGGPRKNDEVEVTKAGSWFAAAIIPDNEPERKTAIRHRVQSFPPRRSLAGSPASSSNGGGMPGTTLKSSGSGVSGSFGSGSKGSGMSSTPSYGKRRASPTELPKEDKTGSTSLAKRPSIKRRTHGSEDSVAEFEAEGSVATRTGRS